MPFNNCAEFVDFLVKEATESLADNTFGFKSDSKAKALSLHLIDLAVTGYGRHFNNGYAGFKDKLVAHDQNGGVYGHILGQGGAALGGFTTYFAAGLPAAVIDGVERILGKKQAQAEYAGNKAGYEVGRHISNFLYGKTPRDPNRLRNSLTSEFCK